MTIINFLFVSEINWITYSGVEDLSTSAISAGTSSSIATYVGQSEVYGNLLPGIIESRPSNNYCFFFGYENCTNSFQYLEHQDDYFYAWIDSQNGEFIESAVPVQTFFIGKILSNGSLYLGTVVPGYGMVYYEDRYNVWHYSNKSYQVLTCKTNNEPVYDCSK